jgi:hypothetical protein
VLNPVFQCVHRVLLRVIVAPRKNPGGFVVCAEPNDITSE